ncbi:hypothetical protein SLW73_07575 [Glutamicibacter protophormiae]|uniref:hypothetical protein n=1 Tax=Glutamicibacter protophormiae TaxID=37930 RepID=UPI002A82495C|nr:hypothetical protein [Glutamicibacter protophormiae]WPR66161.1 hypothetical protein SLW72_07580 [Glutamicibacter protophormiae]WPR69658.1 hypothetical protein SLW73_07575 [Glutamicibacter protophormiae]
MKWDRLSRGVGIVRMLSAFEFREYAGGRFKPEAARSHSAQCMVLESKRAAGGIRGEHRNLLDANSGMTMN